MASSRTSSSRTVSKRSIKPTEKSKKNLIIIVFYSEDFENVNYEELMDSKIIFPSIRSQKTDYINNLQYLWNSTGTTNSLKLSEFKTWFETKSHIVFEDKKEKDEDLRIVYIWNIIIDKAFDPESTEYKDLSRIRQFLSVGQNQNVYIYPLRFVRNLEWLQNRETYIKFISEVSKESTDEIGIFDEFNFWSNERNKILEIDFIDSHGFKTENFKNFIKNSIEKSDKFYDFLDPIYIDENRSQMNIYPPNYDEEESIKYLNDIERISNFRFYKFGNYINNIIKDYVLKKNFTQNFRLTLQSIQKTVKISSELGNIYLNQKVKRYTDRITELESNIRENNDKHINFLNEIKESLNAIIEEHSILLAATSSSDSENEIEEMINAIRESFKQLKEKCERMQSNINEELRQQMKDKEEVINELQIEIQDLRSKISELSDEKEEFIRREMEHANLQIQKDDLVERLKQERDQAISDLSARIKELESEITDLTDPLVSQSNEEYQRQIEELNIEIGDLKTRLSEKEKEIIIASSPEPEPITIIIEPSPEKITYIESDVFENLSIISNEYNQKITDTWYNNISNEYKKIENSILTSIPQIQEQPKPKKTKKPKPQKTPTQSSSYLIPTASSSTSQAFVSEELFRDLLSESIHYANDINQNWSRIIKTNYETNNQKLRLFAQ